MEKKAEKWRDDVVMSIVYSTPYTQTHVDPRTSTSTNPLFRNDIQYKSLARGDKIFMKHLASESLFTLQIVDSEWKEENDSLLKKYICKYWG